MIVIDCEHGSEEWHQARCGKVTASRIADIVRQTKSGVSKMRQTYLGEIVAERMSGKPVTSGFRSKPMEWGIETEDEAREVYGIMRGVMPIKVGLVIHPNIPMAAASPDRLVGEDGLIEIKCPNTATHIDTLLGAKIDLDYWKQIQWQLACTGREWCDFVSYDPRMPSDLALHVTRVVPNREAISALTDAVTAFLGDVDATVQKLTTLYRAKAA